MDRFSRTTSEGNLSTAASKRQKHHLSSAASSSTSSRKSKSVEPNTANNAITATITQPLPMPEHTFRQQLIRQISRDSSDSSPFDPASLTLPGTYLPSQDHRSPDSKRDSIVSSGSSNPSSGLEIRRSSFSTGILRSLDGMQGSASDPTFSLEEPSSQVSGLGRQMELDPSSAGHAPPQSSEKPAGQSSLHPVSAAASARAMSNPRQSRSRAPGPRKASVTRPGNASPGSDRSGQNSDSRDPDSRRPPLGIIGICALDAKARSKPSRNILNRINAKQEFEVIVFGDKVILDEAPENWPICDYLISFFSDGFPLHKAIDYVRLRKPFSVNDLPMQMVLWDRRICLYILDRFGVPTPRRVEVNRDGGPRLESLEMVQHVFDRTGLKVLGPHGTKGHATAPPKRVLMLDDDTLSVDGAVLKKPFVEKPVSGEDHNIHIYYSKDVGGGGRRLFRKINNKSSDADPSLYIPRSITNENSSYIYESFLSTQNHEDVKAYTVGPDFCHAETRKSPVVDGIVKRNTHGKEMRYVTSLTPEESTMASRISIAFGQRICGFDLLRVGNQSFVIDVNGWSFVKDNNDYYDRCARILKDLFVEEKSKRDRRSVFMDGEGAMPSSASESPSRYTTGHFQKVKSILRSPSMSRRVEQHRQGGLRAPPYSSPDLPSQTDPIPASPGFERTLADVGPKPIHHSDTVPSTYKGTLSAEKAKGSSKPRTPVEKGVPVPLPAAKAQWKLKGMAAVIRHADRTPKQKWKFTFHTEPFVDLLKGHREEVLLVGGAALGSVMDAVNTALEQGIEDHEKLKLLQISLLRKGEWPGTKVQIKPMFRRTRPETPPPDTAAAHIAMTSEVFGESKSMATDDIVAGHQKRQSSLTGVTLSREAAAEDNLELDKLQLIIKWGGEPTHSSRYQSQELGENMRNDLLLMNRDALEDLTVYSSSERRVTTSAQLWTAAFLDKQEIAPDYLNIRKDLLDDSNAAKDEMDKVKKKLKGLLRKGHQAPPQFAWPGNMPEPYIVVRSVVDLMKFHRRVMRENFATLKEQASASLLAVKSPASGSSSSSSGYTSPKPQSTNPAIDAIQSRWCCGEDADLFKERWEKLFDEFMDPEKVDPSKISELHDTMKFDALHNRQFLEWIFTPSPTLLEEFYPGDAESRKNVDKEDDQSAVSQASPGVASPSLQDSAPPKRTNTDKTAEKEKGNIAHFIGFRKRAAAIDPATLKSSASDPATQSYFNLYTGNARSKSKTDVRLAKLRELFLYSKILFDFIGPQEYGILDSEKLEIGLLTSLPLLRAIVNDLEDMQASEGAKTSVYFTKESHIYTLLNCIVEGGITTTIDRNKIPELDYLSTINFELYESQNPELDDPSNSFNHSIRITISPGCHTFEPLDVYVTLPASLVLLHCFVRFRVLMQLLLVRQLDSRHCIGFAQRRSLTAHNDWKQVIETLRAKFHTVKLPKSFIAVNLSEKVPQEFQSGRQSGEIGRGSEIDDDPKRPVSLGDMSGAAV